MHFTAPGRQCGGTLATVTVFALLASLMPASPVQARAHDPDTGPSVRVNQVGYLPEGPKNATVVTEADNPLEWRLHDGSGAEVASGQTSPAGFDPSAGLDVHTVDFSDVSATGSGFHLAVDGEESYPFDIDSRIYDQLRHDSLGIYYTQRSGIEITAIEADGELHKEEYERPAGHVSEFGGDDVNQGDLHVPCLPNDGVEDHEGTPQEGGYTHYGDEGWTCPEGYALDVDGGWYDAGDHGKYVVNSGISVYQLLATYERTHTAGVVDEGALDDGTLLIPERDNSIPDVLDEVRWNLDWMLAMQVPEGTEMDIGGETVDAGGLVHHKLHDVAWTGLDTLPHEDPMPRYLHRPSTAATLNLAATAAQGARVFEAHDPDYADELLQAAQRAWDAARDTPEIYAPNTNELDSNPGGGPYDDENVGDEFYWAAAQLFLTTNADRYRDAVLDSPYHVGGEHADIWRDTGFDWGFTAAAGRLDLATVPNTLPDRDAVIDSVVEGADTYLDVQRDEPFGHPYNPGDYDWGSTHQVINNAVVIAAAYDLTGETIYRDAALEAADYVLGRNALNNSYVTGYGTHYSENMHSRWYASADRLPPFPDGKIAGGPNSGIQDPVAQDHLANCAPQTCYIDDIGSWSTNETTINWNAALAWYSSWAADMGTAMDAPDPHTSCAVDYTVHGSWPDGFITQVWVQNLGPDTIEDWTLTWTFPGSQHIDDSWNADVTQDGAQVTVASGDHNAVLHTPDEGKPRHTFGFTGRGPAGHPAEFHLNGEPCTTG
ncbi:glycoside hydrolase family 9 protein [Lipingzhangella sp. LS1_29]|uniref:Endoglucanase n=1 Tax=Lipingzhangella rawalii TaxID=2055835 RepID=A0ABU2H2I7_9ACTN|nr:glycoside hydrolase family 9 protein [Lipingzhangella rawalii]MDS1269517.1 glycoside hydrolase family 9 protein [Lipingzhangella rawalii]